MSTSAAQLDRPDRTLGAARRSFPQKKAFVLQFSIDAGPQTGLFCGRVEHVSSGNQATFHSTEELWSFVSETLLRPEENRSPGRPEDRIFALPAARTAG